MNKTKKTLRNAQNVEKKKKQINISPKLWIIVSAVLGLFLVVAILFDQLYKRPLITINGDKYYLEDLTYYFYNTELSYNYMNQLYGGYYWDMTYDYTTGETVRDHAKSEAINNIIYTEVLYREALAHGYTLTGEEADEIKEDVNLILNEGGLSDKFIKKNGFTPEYLTEILTKFKLADRYREDVIDLLYIDEEAIKADIDYEEYRQYDIEYVFISTTKTVEDEEGKSTNEDMTEEEKKAAYDKIADLREKALTAEDWSELIPEDEEDLKYREYSLLANNTTFPDNFKETVLAMENDEISDIIETEDGYYVVRMVNNNSSKAYDSAVADAIEKAENEAFMNEYNEYILPKYDYKINTKAINNLRMGRITLVD